jgi:hypothetical protein
VPSGSTSWIHDMQAIGSHRSDGDGERCYRVPQVGWKGPQAQVTHKLLGHTGRMEIEKGPEIHVTRKPLGPTGRMEKGSMGTRHIDNRLSGDFYDELQASWMSNYKSHKYTSDGESIVWRSMTKRRRYRSNIVRHISVISSMTKPCSSQF